MKILKYLLYVLLALVVIGVVLGLLGPKTYKVERSTVIAASPDAVWSHMNTLKKVNEWSPFLKADTTAVVEYAGKDGEVGSSSSWKSKKMGNGQQTITAIDPMKSSAVELKFFMPWGDMVSGAYINLEPDPAGTKVIWGMAGKNNFVGRAMGVVMSMEKNVGPFYEKGLADLKTMVESAPKAPKMDMTYQINAGQYPGGKYLSVRKTIAMSGIADFFSKNTPLLMEALKKGKVEMAGPPSGIYYTWDEKKMESNMAVAVPIKGDMKAPAGMEVISLPANKALMIDYVGGYGKMGDAHMAMDAHIKTNKLEQVPPVMEVYFAGPGTEPDSNKWMTKIMYLVK
ncbi:MAG: SRPBCC family protein [Saprospiraceae bacterium]